MKVESNCNLFGLKHFISWFLLAFFVVVTFTLLFAVAFGLFIVKVHLNIDLEIQ